MDFFAKLNNIEQTEDLSNIKANGIWVYPLVKHVLHLYLSPNIEVSPSKKKFLSSYIDSLKWSLKNKPLKNYDILVSGSSFSRRKVDDKYSLIYSDFLYNLFPDYNILTFESPSGNPPNHYEEAASKNIYYPDLNFLMNYFKSIFRKKVKPDESAVRKLLALLNIKDENLLVSINLKVNRFFVFRDFYIKLLKKINPKTVVIICSYTYQNAALICAAKELNIPVVEFQHGHIGENHPGYIYKRIYGSELFPDYFFTYGKHFSDILKSESCFLENDNILSAGFPYLENMLVSSSRVNEQDNKNEKRQILITSQWANRDELKPFALKLAAILPEDFVILYKTHPKEDNIEEFYKDLISHKKIKFISQKDVSSLELMKKSFVHSTVWSTSFYEANYFGLPNIFIYLKDFSFMVEKHIDNKVNFMAKSPEEYVNILLKLSSEGENLKPKIKVIAEEFFKASAEEQFKEFIPKIIEGNLEG